MCEPLIIYNIVSLQWLKIVYFSSEVLLIMIDNETWMNKLNEIGNLYVLLNDFVLAYGKLTRCWVQV